MSNRRRLVAVSLLAVASFLARPVPASAWGAKEHVQLTRLAVVRLLDDPQTPEPMKAWLRQIQPDTRTMEQERDWFITAKMGATPKDLTGLSRYAIEPDIKTLTDKKSHIEPYGVPERPMHFVDLEIFVAGDRQRKYRHDLSAKPKLSDISLDWHDTRYRQAGFLPFAVQRSYDGLVRTIRDGRLTASEDRPGDEDHAARWAGYLAHYVGDNFQPQHASVDYKSAAYFADQRTAPNVHSEVEWRMNDDEKQAFPQLRADFWAAFEAALKTAKNPSDTPDMVRGTLEVSLLSYDALPLIGTAAMQTMGQKGPPDQPQGRPLKTEFDTEAFFRFRGPVRGEVMSVLEMKARQQAMAVVRTSELLRRAWDDAHATPAATNPVSPVNPGQ